MNLQRKAVAALVAIVAVPLMHAATPLPATPSSNTVPASLSTIPDALRITPAPPPPQEDLPHIFLFFAPGDAAPQPPSDATAAPATQAAAAPAPAAPAQRPAPAITFVAPKPPPHADPPPADPPAPQYHLSTLARHMVASCLVLEAASQGEYGMRGVMAVIRNRAHGDPHRFLPTVLQQKQFSALNEVTAGHESMSRVVARAEQDRMWPVALKIVDEATRDGWRDPTRGATHYTRVGEHTEWTNMLARTVTIGRHAFYR